jgi:putative DNA primase/helicase
MKDTVKDNVLSLIDFEKKAKEQVTEDSAALEFARRHHDHLRFDHTRGKWFCWTGTHWKCETTKLAFSWARDLARELAKNKSGKAKYIMSKVAFAGSVEKFAQADRAFAVTSEIWDSDPWLLNTPGGIVDLRTGETRLARPEDYCTKITAVPPGGDCLLWMSFLQRITGENEELIEFLQRMLGYALTGVTQEHAMFFAHGRGANGKSVLLNTVAGILADYHTTAPIETFTAGNGNRHPTELAGLCGARLVTSIETEEGKPWAEAKIKALTGGDPIAARFMNRDFFTFMPNFKLIVAGNHKPSLRTVDEAIRRRMNMIPFSVVIPPEDRDPELTEKLKDEWPGILTWMIDGCGNWQDMGLRPPKVVQDYTAEYFENEDAVKTWIEECCELDPQSRESSKSLFESWAAWAQKSGEPIGTKKALMQKLMAHQRLRHFRTNKERGFSGIRLVGQDCGVTDSDAL